MKKELTSIEVFFIAKELKELEGQRLDKVYQLAKQEFLFQFQSKKFLVIKLPSKIYIADKKPETPERLGGIAAKLRKELGNQRLNNVLQIDSERILCFEFDKIKVFIELFGKGKIIIDKYSPEKTIDTFNLAEKEFVEQFVGSKENISKTLAVKFALGGIYAKELCIRASVEPTAKTDEETAKKIFAKLKELLKQKTHAHLVLEDSEIKDATPFLLEAYKHLKNRAEKTFSSALEQAFAVKKTTAQDKQIAKIDKMIKMQEQNFAELEKKSQQEQEKGKFLYDHYQEIKQLVDEISKAREKKQSWDEIKKKFKQIKEIDKAASEVLIEF